MLLGLLLAVLMGNAQSKGKIPTKDFQLWVKLNNEKLASDGKWISFTIANTSGKDTLLLLNTVNNQVQKIPSGRNGNFSPDANWFTYNKDNEVVLIDLNNNKARNFSNNKKLSEITIYLNAINQTNMQALVNSVSNPSSVMFARTGLMIPPCGVPASVGKSSF